MDLSDTDSRSFLTLELCFGVGAELVLLVSVLAVASVFWRWNWQRRRAWKRLRCCCVVSFRNPFSLSPPSRPHSCTSRPESQQPLSCLAPASVTPTAATPAKEQQLRSITMPAELPKRGEHQFPPAVLLFKRSPILSLSASSRWAGGRAIDPPSLASLFRLFLFFTVLPYVVPVLPSLHL